MSKKVDALSKWIKGAVGDKPQKKKSGKRPAHKKHSAKRPQGKPRGALPVHKGVMRVIPIGGLEEVGKNAMIVEYENELVVIDMGFQFPEDDMLGVDYVIPDIRYLVERKRRIKAMIITHGHLDHIGALPFVMEDLGFPTIYTSKLTKGLIQKQLEEYKLEKKVKIELIDDHKTYRFGKFEVDFFRVNHSIPDARGLFLRTPAGSMVHTGDFKFDFTPADGVPANIEKMKAIGKKGVNILFSDSTNSMKPGHTLSESVVAENLEKAISGAQGRIIIASFSSLLGRIQQIIDFALRHNRRVFVSGRSMQKNIEIAVKLGFVKFPKDVVQPIKNLKGYDDSQVLILTTGSQGEPMAALSRMANDQHAQVKIGKGDTIVVSATPIIGNAKAMAFMIDKLARLGADIVHNGIMDIHTSGHGYQEDLKLMMSLVKPDHLVPVHGNHFMRKAHADLAPQVGIPAKNTHLMDNGNVIEIRGGKVGFKREDIRVNYVVVDGAGLGDLGSVVLKDRAAMSENGIVHVFLKAKKGKLIGAPLVTTHGFIYQKETGKIVKEIENRSRSAYLKHSKEKPRANYGDRERYVKQQVAGYIIRKLDRRPVVAVNVVSV